MMAGIRGKDTKPEKLLRSGLFLRGFRFRIHRRDLPGKPDIVFSGRRAVIFVNGCFWHGHGCHLFKWPTSNSAFWKQKVEQTRVVDQRACAWLLADGWRVCHVWECAMRGRQRRGAAEVLDQLEAWLASTASECRIEGRPA